MNDDRQVMKSYMSYTAWLMAIHCSFLPHDAGE